MSAGAWSTPGGVVRVTTVDAHTAGEPFRVVTGGVPAIPGSTILEKRRWAREKLDGLRRALMWEPRGHADMYGCFVTGPVAPGSALGVLFMHNEGFSTMCGHGIIALATVALEAGMLPATEGDNALAIDTPAGTVRATAFVKAEQVASVTFRNVPSFAAALGERIEVPGIGAVTYDLAFGGAFYAVTDATALGLRCEPGMLRKFIEAGSAIKAAIQQAREVRHPFEEDLGFLYGVIFTGPPEQPGSHSRNVCVFADGEVDRSPTGTGVSARLAIHHARGEIEAGREILIESILGTRFSGRVVEGTTFGPHRAVVPEVGGSAHITGRHEFLIDPRDDLREGFILR
jgi:trans-L-3-hydroxyproline dehydratase